MIQRIVLYTLFVGICIYVALWMFSFTTYKLEYGISFDQNYAQFLGFNWREAYRDILRELEPKYVRVSAPWGRIEEKEGVYFFDDTDYLLDEALQQNAQVTLVIGQKAPRWPECYIPSWADDTATKERTEKFLAYVRATVDRYKDHKALELWQVENEPFINFPFGECVRFDETIVAKEADLVRSLDPKRQIIVTDSGELSTWFTAATTGDILGTTLYRAVRAPYKGIVLSYSVIPPAFYKARAALWGKTYDTLFVSELQTEPWFKDNSLAGIEKEMLGETLSLEKFDSNAKYAARIGASRAYMWGPEWWYWLKETQQNSAYWDKAKEILSR